MYAASPYPLYYKQILNTVQKTISDNFKVLTQFLKSADFSKAIMVGVALLVPIALGILLDQLEIGLALCFGAFWCSPSDVNGSFRHKKIGILISAILITIVSFIGGYLQFNNWYSLPIIGLLTFLISYISIYGFRASLISFSGLLALVLSFAHDTEDLEIYQNALLIGLGGMWYLLLAIFWHRLKPNSQTEEALSKIFELTSDFIKNRGKLIHYESDRKSLQDELQKVQVELMEHHETLREILILSRKSSGKSSYKGKRLLVFVQLIDILETAIANPVNYDKMDAFFKENPDYLKSYQDLIFEMAHQLRLIATAGKSARQVPDNKKLSNCLKKVKKETESLRESETSYENFIMLQNLIDYQEKQFEKLRKIKWLLGNPDLSTVEAVNHEESKRFIVPQDYDPKLLLTNLSFRSNIFKHSMRLAVVLMFGYIVGALFDFQNPYWILLTIIVILRPSYGLTKTRAKDRMIGTLIGGAIATALVLMVQNTYLLGSLGILSLIIALSMVQKNYKTAAVFITLSVVFIYAIIQEDVLNVIKFRIVDTLLGAGLSFIGTLLLWPVWAYHEIKEDIKKSVVANRQFLHQITTYYQEKGKVPTALRVSRKQAFLETSNLSSAFQRMAQEPQSKQKNLDKIYELVELNHNFLASLASLSTYIQSHPTTEASEMFKTVTAKVDENLEKAIQIMEEDAKEIRYQKNNSSAFFKKQLKLFKSQNSHIQQSEDKKIDRNYQETQLVWEQLYWLNSLSDNILKLTSKI